MRHGILLKVARGHRFFPLQDILAAEARDRYAEILLAHGERCPVFHGLGELEERLKCGHPIGGHLFWRVHRRYIAGLHHATSLSHKRMLTLGNDLELPVSRDQCRSLIQACGTVH